MSPRHLLSGRSAAAWAVVAACLLPGAAAQAATLAVTVLAKDGQPLADAVVIVEPANPGKRAALAPIETEIQQEKLQFVPKVSVIPVGSKVVFSNLDRYDHHVRALPAGLAGLNAAPETGFTLLLPAMTDGKPPASATETLAQAGPLQLGCHLHGSMRGSIYVADSPWVVKTNDQGVATVTDLPEGPAQVRLWYPQQLGEQPVTPVTVTPKTSLSVPTSIRQPRRRL
jgi:plastocyanin